MAHRHSVYDTDPHFKIDKVTRNIVDQSQVKTILMQGDHNSERYTFEMPRKIDGHDMSLCNEVEIHYVNTNSNTREENRSFIRVEDMQPSPDDPENVIIFSWLITNAVTMFVGALSFSIRFACIAEDGTEEYSWSTNINKDKTILPRIFNSESIHEQYQDIIGQLFSEFAMVKNKVDSLIDGNEVAY